MPTPRNLRLATAYLESVSEADRAWLLARLPADLVREVEVQRTVIPKHILASHAAELLRDVFLAPPVVIASPPSISSAGFDAFMEDAAHQVLVKADDKNVLAILQPMPDWFCRALMQLQPWPWQEAVLRARPFLRNKLQARTIILGAATRRSMVRAMAAALESPV
jgi:hypothetical protein